MALPTSGALSLDAIHVEAGGTTNTTASFNDSDIRGLTPAAGKTINSTLGTQIDFNNFYGASSAPSAPTVTVGHGNFVFLSVQYRYRGYMSFTPSGQLLVVYFPLTSQALSPTTATGFLGGNTILGCFCLASSNSVTTVSEFNLYVGNSAGSISNTNSSAFTTLTVGSTSFSRSSATFSSALSDPTPHYRWKWDNSANQSTPAPNNSTDAYSPFAATGGSTTLTFA
tara:strand:- start:89 stop:766 length:678 start_codon:yes stop_codon:yes gene_type:complete